MADENVPETEETPEVEAHSEEVLGLQGISIDEAGREGLVVAPGSCSSCAGSLCS